jgi:parallel beta-helix repeat protein
MRRASAILAVLLLGAAWAAGCNAADLVIDGRDGERIDGGSYDRLVIRNSSGITVRNARFAIASTGAVVSVRDSHDIVIENSDIDGGGEACEGVSITNSHDVRIVGNLVHDIADDGFEVGDSSGLWIEGNTVYRLIAKGTDGRIPGPCFNGHSDGIELARVSSSTFTGNLIFDVRSTAAVFLSNDASGPSQYCRDLVFTNNVFVTPESGFTMYAFQTAGLAIHNNVIWKGSAGGLAIGEAVTDLDVTNNVLHSINYGHSDAPYVPAEHRYRHNRVADVAGWNDTPAIFGDERGNAIGQPDFTGAPNLDGFGSDPSAWRQIGADPLRFALEDFTPAEDSALLDGGDDATAPVRDALGTARPQGLRADVGAVERAPEPTGVLPAAAAFAALGLQARTRRAPARR